MQKILFLGLLILSTITLKAQNNSKLDRPKLVIGIVVDQMRYDYLTRFYDKYSDDGFKRLINDGFNCENAHLNYMPTHTAVGHATIYTGTTPDTHGIIGNNWYDQSLKKSIYCVDDFSHKAVGTKKEGEQKSPYRMLTTTITDELRLSQNMKGKTISISIKDRAAVLPGGHTSNGSYWFIGKDEGKFITSTYYMDKLPKWVKDFNELELPKKYVKLKWETLYPIETYTESIVDDNIYEGLFKGEKSPTFPHDLAKLRKKNKNFDLVKSTPFGNEIIVEFAKTAIKNENLGKGVYTDFLAMSFSSTDYIGHQFGVDSKEVEDTYLRLDKEIADFLKYLDNNIGENNYTLFLTSDHGAYQVPAYLMSKKIPGGKLKSDDFKSFLTKISNKHFNSDKIIENFSNYQIFLNKDEIMKLDLEKNKVSQILADEIINYNGVHKVVTAYTLQNTNFTNGVLEKLQNGYNQKLSGDVFIIPNPVNITYSDTGSSHGSGYSFDTHVPVMFFGKGIKKGSTKKWIPIIDIAPTMANLLHIENPSGTTGKIIEKALK
ncbi:MAG: sulfatase-like hydrolase/transferase [Flavobacteriaceae bacterium]|nr:sulfatase-like hydrolase/transferase [Flavobacteriaceae bacterium]